MTNPNDLSRLALLNLLLDKLADEHPAMTLETARRALKAVAIHAATEPKDDRTIRQAAAEIFASDAVQSQLPPWH
jgi:hypothetical protein